MVKHLLFSLLICLPLASAAQDILRVEVSGIIKAPKGEDVEGVTIYNNTSQKGTTSAADGSFKIEVSENDRLLIAAIQFQSFTVIVDQGIVTGKKMSINLSPALNTLAEVVVRPYDLSGNINADVGKIKVSYITKDWDLSYRTMEFDSNFTDDALSQYRGNAAEDALNEHKIKNGLNFVNIFAALAKEIFPKKKKSKLQIAQENQTLVFNLQNRFSKAYVVSTFSIAEDNAADFLFYAQEVGIPQNLLKSENEMELIELLMHRSDEYKKLGE